MKALGCVLMDQVMYLNQLGVISATERAEYARIIQGAMLRKHEKQYTVLKNKLKDKLLNCSDVQRDALYTTIYLIPEF